MADLLAVVNHRGEPAAPAALDGLLYAYVASRGDGRVQRSPVGGSAIAAVIEHAPVAGTGVAGWEGGWTAWAGVVDAFRGDPSAPWEQVEGQFAAVRLDTTAEGAVAEVATDAFGLKPLFVAIRDAHTLVSTSMTVLARCAGGAIDDVETLRFLRTGKQWGAPTMWQRVRRLEPASCLRVTRDTRRTRWYWRPAIDRSVAGLSLADAAGVGAHCVRAAAMALAGAGDRWLDLTGGFDTRMLAVAAKQIGIPYTANTVGDERDPDVVAARRVACALGAPWQRFSLEDDWPSTLTGSLPSVAAWADGRFDVLQLSEVLATHRRQSRERQVLWNGGGGELFRAGPWGTDASRGTRLHLDRWVQWGPMRPIDTAMFRRDPDRVVANRTRDIVEEYIRRFDDEPASVRLDLAFALGMGGHFGAYAAAASRDLRVELPLFSRSTFEAAASMKPAHRRLHRLQRHMMRRLDPMIAALATQEGGTAEPWRLGNAHRLAPYAWRRSERLRRPFVASAVAPTITQRRRDEGRARLMVHLDADHRLDPARMRTAHLLSPSGLDALLGRCRRATASEQEWTLLGRLLGLEYALEFAD